MNLACYNWVKLGRHSLCFVCFRFISGFTLEFFLAVAGRSPIEYRRQRLPSSLTPLAKHKLSQLPPQYMKPNVPENSHSSISSTSTVKDTNLREQQKTAKFLTDATSNTNSSMYRPENSESSSELLQKQCNLMLGEQTRVRNTRPEVVEEGQRGIRCSGRYGSPFHVSSSLHINNRGIFANDPLKHTLTFLWIRCDKVLHVIFSHC